VADNTAGLHPHPESFRLAARALEKAGWLYRHQDRPDRAYHSHLSAYHIRNEHGSFEETWETATSLGHDADLAGKHADCQSWHRIAIQAAARAAEEPERRQAISFTNLSLSLIKSNLHEDAVAAARTARHWWHKHDMGSSAAARADLILGHALLRHGERLCEAGNTNAQAVLDDAMQLLTSAREALSAFGDDTSADVRWCDEQTDFAQRLRSSLEA